MSSLIQAQPTQPKHWTEIDIETETDTRLLAIGNDLNETPNPSGIDPFTLFTLESLGYVVDLATGTVTNERV